MMNSSIIKQFALLIKQVQDDISNAKLENNLNEANKQSFRLASIRNALTAIKKLDFEIESSSDVKGMYAIGPGTLRRIDEILNTGKLSELKDKIVEKNKRKIDSVSELKDVIGIGGAMAKKLVLEYNITNVSELKKAVQSGKLKVSNAIKKGLKYYDVIQRKIPRKEITQIEKYLNKQVSRIDPDLNIMICGSYRRGNRVSGDIDVLLYHPNVKTMKQIMFPDKYHLQYYLINFVDLLTKEGFLIDDLVKQNMKYMGFCQYRSNAVRRIDIRFIPYQSLPTAMLYFTGPKELNTTMRSIAKRKGMLLNEYGLYELDEDDIRTLIKVKSEKDIFDIIGMEYLTPEEREKYNTKTL